MGLLDILFIGIGLSMDAAAVSMSNGMCLRRVKIKTAFIVALFFGAFQGIMPLIGHFAGSAFSGFISNIDHWVALILLGIIGGKMIFDSLKKDDDDSSCRFLTAKLLFVQAIATSIDALAVGVSFAATGVNIIWAATVIAITTFIISFISVYLGKKFGTLLNSKAELFGGIILVGIGLKIFIEHMFF